MRTCAAERPGMPGRPARGRRRPEAPARSPGAMDVCRAGRLQPAAAYWGGQRKAGEPVAARVINTSSGAGLLGSVGQFSYSAAKAGILGLTLVAAAELGRYGVTVNAIAPSARTRMTEGA